jgi:hypothetical protein
MLVGIWIIVSFDLCVCVGLVVRPSKFEPSLEMCVWGYLGAGDIDKSGFWCATWKPGKGRVSRRGLSDAHADDSMRDYSDDYYSGMFRLTFRLFQNCSRA